MMSKMNMNSNPILLYYFMVLIAFLPIGCSNIKYLPEGENLYVRGEVEIETDTIPQQYIKPLEVSLEELLRPKPNTTILGLRPQLYLYNIAGEPKSDRGFRNWLRNKVGQAPCAAK